MMQSLQSEPGVADHQPDVFAFTGFDQGFDEVGIREIKR